MTRFPALGSVLSAAAVAGLAIALLSGCTTGAPSEPAAAPSSPTVSSRPTPAAASDPAVVAAATCETVLTADGYAKLESDGLAPIETAYLHRLADQLSDAGGLTCTWGKPQTDIVLTVVQLPVAEADRGPWATNLTEAGYVESHDPVAGAHTGPVDPGTGVASIAIVDGDRITFLNTGAFAGMVAPAA